MNRYFWLLSRFISDDQSREDRLAVYERARLALLDQLDADPNGSQAAYERLSFEEAVRTVEAGVARWGRPENA